MTLDEFNTLAPDDAYALVHGCCHCRHWARQLVADRPFTSVAHVQARAAHHWALGGEAELLEACLGHAKIGDTQAIKRGQQTAREQGQVASAPSPLLAELARLNVAYEAKFGFIYLVCASGKSAEQLLALLQNRMHNARAQEITNARAEQAAITQLRLAQLFS